MKRPELTTFPVRQQTRGILPQRVLDIRRAPAAFRRRPGPVLGSLSVISLTLGLAIGGGFWLRRNHVQREMALQALVAERTRSLQNAHLQVRTLFLNSPLAICLATPVGDVLAVNPALATLTGYPETVLEQTNVFELFDTPELRQRQDDCCRQATARHRRAYRHRRRPARRNPSQREPARRDRSGNAAVGVRRCQRAGNGQRDAARDLRSRCTGVTASPKACAT